MEGSITVDSLSETHWEEESAAAAVVAAEEEEDGGEGGSLSESTVVKTIKAHWNLSAGVGRVLRRTGAQQSRLLSLKSRLHTDSHGSLRWVWAGRSHRDICLVNRYTGVWSVCEWVCSRCRPVSLLEVGDWSLISNCFVLGTDISRIEMSAVQLHCDRVWWGVDRGVTAVQPVLTEVWGCSLWTHVTSWWLLSEFVNCCSKGICGWRVCLPQLSNTNKTMI